MALTLGELSGIISLDERPAMTSLGRVRRGMQDTANEGQRSTDRLTTQQARYAAAVETASSNVTRARQRERDAADTVRVSEGKLGDVRQKAVNDTAAISVAEAKLAEVRSRNAEGSSAVLAAENRLAQVRQRAAAGSAAVVQAESRVAAAHGRARAAQDDTARSTRDLEVAQRRLADSVEADSERINTSFGKIGSSGNRAGRTAAKAFALITVGLVGVVPAAGAAGSALVAAAGSVLTLAGSMKQLLGVTALAPAALFAVGSGAGVLVSAFQGMGEALKTATEETGEAAGNSKLDAMTLADAARGVAQAERAAADQRAAAAKAVSDAQENAARTQQDAAERVASAEKKAADDRAAAARRLADAQQDLTQVVERNAEQHAAALRRVTDAERDVERAQRSVREAQQDLTQARADAVRQIDDLNDSLKGSGLAERDAALRYEDALAAFNKGIQAGAPENSRAMRGLKLDLDQAAFGLEEAKEEAERLRLEQAKGVKDGVKGNKQVIDAEQALKDARQAATDAVSARADAVAEVAKVERENARRVVEAQEAIADATREAAKVQIESAANIAEAVEDGAEAQADAAEAVAEAVADAAKSQIDSAEAVADAHRNLERVQIQQAEAAAKATEKSVAAMEKLTPAAQVAAVALLDVYRRLGQVQDAIQEEFFTGFADPLRELADVVLPQLLSSSGNTIAGALGRGMQQIMRSLASGLDDGVLLRMLGKVADTFEILNGAIDPAIQSLITLTDVGMDYMPRMGAAIRDAALEFDAFVQQAASDGSLRQWIDDGIDGTKDLFSILGSTLGILDKLEDAARTGGIATTLSSVADGLDRIEDQVSGPVFQKTMSTIFAGARGGAEGLLVALGPIGEAFRTGGPALAEFLRLGGEIAGTFVGSMFTGLSDPNFGAGLTSFLEDVQDGVEELGPKLPDLFSALGDILETAGPIVEAFGPTAVEVLIAFAEGFGAILDEVEPLMTELADSPVAVGIFLGIIGAAATLNTIATFTTAINGVAAAFRLMWGAALGPAGLVIAGFAVVTAAATWFFNETDTGQKMIRDSAVELYTKWEEIKTWFVRDFSPTMAAATATFSKEFTDAETSVATSLLNMRNGGTTTAVWWAGKLLDMKDTTTRELAGVRNSADDTRVSWASSFLGMKTTTTNRMADIVAKVREGRDNLKLAFAAIGTALDKVPGYFESAKTGAMAAWNLMKEEAKKPIRFVVNTVMGGMVEAFWEIPGINKKNLPKPTLPAGFATGGRIPGYSPSATADNIPIMATANEFMVRQKSAKQIERNHPGALDYMNQYGRMPGIDNGTAMPGYATGGFIWPVGGQYPITQRPSGGHRAYDIGTPEGTPVRAAAAGRVSLAGPGYRAPGVWGGTEVHLDHGGGVGSLYAHLSQLLVRVGQMVNQNQMIARSGNTGISSGAHLHFGGLQGGYDMVSPDQYLNGRIPKGAFGPLSGGGQAAPESPFDGIADALMGRFEKAFPGGGMFADAGGGLAKSGVTKAIEWVDQFKDTAVTTGKIGVNVIKDKAGDIAGEVVDSLKSFFGTGDMALPPATAGLGAPTLFDGGGWLHDTGGPQLVDHRHKKPDANTPYDEWQQMKRDYAELAGGGTLEGNLYLDSGEFLGRVRGEVRKEIDKAGSAQRYRRVGV